MDEVAFIKFCQSAFDLPVSRESLNVLSSEFVKNIYILFLNHIGFDNLQQADLNAIHGIDNIERYDELIITNNIIMIMQKILEARQFKGPKFGLMDLIRPEKKRTMAIFSNLLQIYVRLGDARDLWNQHVQAIEPRIREAEEIKRKNDDLCKQFERLSAQLAQHKSQQSTKAKILKEETDKLKALQEKCKTLEATYKAEKQSLLELKSDVAEKELLAKQLREKLEASKKLLVSSPEEFAIQVAEKKAAIVAYQDDKRKMEQQVVEIMAQIQTLQKVSGLVQLARTSHIDPLWDLFHSFKEKCDSLSKIEAERTDAEIKHANTRRLLTLVEEKLKAKREELALLKSSEERDLSPLKQLVADSEAEAASLKEKITLQDEVDAALDNERDNMKKRLDQLMDTVLRKEQEMRDKLEETTLAARAIYNQ